MKVKISIEEIRRYLDIETPEFPKYVAPLINLANQYAQGTRPKVVGQMTELIQEFEGKTLSEWEKWYLEKKPDAIRNATDLSAVPGTAQAGKILQKLKELKNSLNKIDQKTVEQWVRDLVIVKTFAGLRFQEAILKKGAELKGANYRLVEPYEESKGIDGYTCLRAETHRQVGDIPVSIKPYTYEVKAALPEHIDIQIIFYRKVGDGIEVDYGEIL